MIPIHLKTSSTGKPPEGTHYIVARNGLFLHKKMPWVDAVVPVQELKTLELEGPFVKLLLPSLPVEILAKALKLSKAIYDSSRSEVCLLLHYGEVVGYQLTVPQQIVSPGGIDYEASVRLPDALCVGTIHSHGSFEACHSVVDHADEEFSDGVHVTLGDIELYPGFSLSAEIVVNGIRFPMDHSWFQGINPMDNNVYFLDEKMLASIDIPADWLRAVQCGKPRRSPRKEKKE